MGSLENWLTRTYAIPLDFAANICRLSSKKEAGDKVNGCRVLEGDELPGKQHKLQGYTDHCRRLVFGVAGSFSQTFTFTFTFTSTSSKMRQKRAKTYRKLMALYSMSFGFRQPYQTLSMCHWLQLQHFVHIFCFSRFRDV